jgi:hypothetical protein
MAAADVKFYDEDWQPAETGKEQVFSFQCPKHKGRRCAGLVIAGKTDLKRDPNGKNGGVAQWDWDHNRDKPNFAPSVNCGGCWHGYIRAGRTVSTSGSDEPEPA